MNLQVQYRQLFQLKASEREEIFESLQYSDKARADIVAIIDRVDRLAAGESPEDIYGDANHLGMLLDLVSQAEYLRCVDAEWRKQTSANVTLLRKLFVGLLAMNAMLYCAAVVLLFAILAKG